MDRVSGAIIVIVALFALWALNTGRLKAISDIIAKGPTAQTYLSSSSAANPSVTQAACHNIASAACGTAIGKAAADIASGKVLSAAGDVTSVLKGIFG